MELGQLDRGICDLLSSLGRAAVRDYRMGRQSGCPDLALGGYLVISGIQAILSDSARSRK